MNIAPLAIFTLRVALTHASCKRSHRGRVLFRGFDRTPPGYGPDSQLESEYYDQVFQREMAVAARVSHPNLLRFYGAKLEGGMTILTELMPTSLREDQVLLQQHYDFTLAQWRGEMCPQCVCVD